MTAPKLKTNSLISELTPSIEAGRLLISDIEKQQRLREARAIPERYQSLAIEGMIHFLDDKPRLGAEALERALALCPGDGVTWTNYGTILSKKALYTRECYLLERAIQQPVPVMFQHALAFGAFWGDMEKMTKAHDLIKKYGAEVTHAQDALLTYDMFQRLDSSVREDIKNAATVVQEIAEERGICCVRSHIESDGYGEMSFSCEVNIEDASTLTQLNNSILDRMVSRGYEKGKCVAYFESVGAEES
ncbi:hypothetical protein OJE16_10000 [Pantoea tagorei]